MKHGKDDEPRRLRDVEDNIGKSRYHGSTNFTVDSGTRFWSIANAFEALPERGQKFVSKTKLFRLIPLERRLDVMLCARSNDKSLRHEERRILANTSSSDAPESGSASNSTRRRSSSSRCHCVSGNASGTAETLSQIASMRRMRSGTGRARISAISSCFMRCTLSLTAGTRETHVGRHHETRSAGTTPVSNAGLAHSMRGYSSIRRMNSRIAVTNSGRRFAPKAHHTWPDRR
jgi:hypothetical protein